MLTSIARLEAHYQALFAVIITFAVVCIWHGFDQLIEIYVWPERPVLRAVTALLTGLGILAATHLIVRTLL